MHGVHKNQKSIINRIRRIGGQIAGIEKMVNEDRYCVDIIVQTSAIKKAISALEDEMMESHLMHCLSAKHKHTNKDLSEEIVKVYKLKSK